MSMAIGLGLFLLGFNVRKIVSQPALIRSIRFTQVELSFV